MSELTDEELAEIESVLRENEGPVRSQDVERLVAEVRRLRVRVEELERWQQERFSRGLTIGDEELKPDDPWTGVVGFFKGPED